MVTFTPRQLSPESQVSDFPAFLASYDDLDAHLQDYFKKLKNVEKGTRFATFVAQLVVFIPEFREFGEARLSENLSNDGGVDVVSDPLEDGRRLCIQAKLRMSTKEEVDTILSKFEAYERAMTAPPGQATLFDRGSSPPPTFGIVTASKIDGIVRRYRDTSMSSRPYYDRLIAEDRLHIVDGVKLLRILQAAYGSTYDVPSELTLRLVGAPIHSGSVRLGFLRASTLVDLYREHGDAVFFENIRDYLGPTSGRVAPDQPTVNEEIAQTIAEEPRRFLERNNGVTFKARKVEPARDGKLKLTDASIVNGCQTTMTLVGARQPLDECIVQVKIIESDDAWDVAKAANFQNTVDKIDLDLARYLRRQVVRKAASEAGVEIEGARATSAIALLGTIYDETVQYEEVRHLYIGLMSRSPNNIADNLYTKLRTDLITGFAENIGDQKRLMATLFRIIVATRIALMKCEEVLGSEEYMRPFLRFFNDRKPQYRIFLSILTLCAMVRMDVSDRLDDPDQEMARMREFITKAAAVLEQDQSGFVKTYVRAVGALASEARLASDDDNKIRQALSKQLQRGFKGVYQSLLMSIDMDSRLARI